MSNKVPSLSDRRKEAGVPIHISREELSSLGVVTFINKEPATATVPQTGETGEGYLVTVEDDNGNKYTTFIGNQILMRDLDMIQMPFRARIIKRGRAWVFSE